MPSVFLAVNVAILCVDMSAMIELDLHTLRENPTWLAVLYAYQTAIEELAAAEAEAAAAARPAKRGSSKDNSATSQTPTPEASPDDDATADDSSSIEEASSDDSDADDTDDSSTKRRRGSSWVARLKMIDGADSAELSRIHGRLIAYGYLKCDLTDRSAGVVYQLTAEAKQVLAQIEAADFADEAEEPRTEVA